MKIYQFIEGYPYQSVSAVIKVGVKFAGGAQDNAVLKICINGESVDLVLDHEYLIRAGKAFFGINLYRFGVDEAHGNYIIDLILDNEIQDTLIYKKNADFRIESYISEQMKSLPRLLPLPIDSGIFSKLHSQVYPSPYTEEYDSRGILILKNLLDNGLVDRAYSEIDDLSGSGYQGYQQGSSQRLQQMHTLGGAITEIFQSTRIRLVLEQLYGVEMIPCQSLVYKYGSQQGVHSDFVHLTAYPQNLMCGVWVALEDVQVGSGELLFYPGSHKEKRLLMSDFGLDKVINNDYSKLADTFIRTWSEKSLNYPVESAFLKKGDVLVWDGNLLHAGSNRLDFLKTRRSVVFHYFGRGAVCYYDATGDIGFAADLRFN
jgi:hypothetical protein